MGSGMATHGLFVLTGRVCAAGVSVECAIRGRRAAAAMGLHAHAIRSAAQSKRKPAVLTAILQLLRLLGVYISSAEIASQMPLMVGRPWASRVIWVHSFHSSRWCFSVLCGLYGLLRC
jgi:hypothetical protein